MTITAAEQYLLELINRARLDPLAEAARYAIDLNQGLSPGRIDGTAKQVLAHDALLAAAAQTHSEWMLATDTFSHTGEGGSSPGDRMEEAGYVFSGSWTWGENLAWAGTTGTMDLDGAIDTHHRGLFESPGHRVNLMNGAFREIGVSQVQGDFRYNGTTYDSSMLTEKFATSGSELFVTGAVYDDADGDGFYSIGEGASGVTIAAGGASDTSAAAGGYEVAVAPATTVSVIVSGTAAAALTLRMDGANAKLDVVGGDWLHLSASAELVSGIADARLLGVADLDLTGSGAANRLVGNSGDNALSGGGGDDTLEGGAGADTLTGGAGDDTASYAEAPGGVTVRLWSGEGLAGAAAGDVLSGIEHLAGSAHADLLVGGGGGNRLSGGAGADSLWGAQGDDTLEGGAGADALHGQTGDDTASYAGSASAVTVRLWAREGTAGDAQGDTLVGIENLAGSAHADLLVGDALGNHIGGGGGADALWGNDGDDTLEGGAGADLLYGQAGADWASYAGAETGVQVRLWSRDGLSGEAAGDRLIGIENLAGSAHADVLVGDALGNHISGGGGADALWGNDGDDTLEGGAGADLLYGQAGADWASYAGADSGVAVRLWAGAGVSGDAAGDVLAGIENLRGSAFADVLAGDAGDNVFEGGAGADSIWANGGADTLIGGAGADRLVGQGGADVFVFRDGDSPTATPDRILDFEDGLDRLDVTGLAGVDGVDDLTLTVSGGDTLIEAGATAVVLVGFAAGTDGMLDAADFV